MTNHYVISRLYCIAILLRSENILLSTKTKTNDNILKTNRSRSQMYGNSVTVIVVIGSRIDHFFVENYRLTYIIRVH